MVQDEINREADHQPDPGMGTPNYGAPYKWDGNMPTLYPEK